MRPRHFSVVVLLTLLAGCDEHAGSPLSPTPDKPLQGTYTLTAYTSWSCGYRGGWKFRADITEDGRALQVRLWKWDGSPVCDTGVILPCQWSFQGQETTSGVRFFPDSEGKLFVSQDPEVAFVRGQGTTGTGIALGQYVDGRIEALYDGQVVVGFPKTQSRCYAADHELTFIRQ